MKLIACLSVYNEAQFIGRALAGLRRNGIDSAVAIDGAYQGFPHNRWASDDGTINILRRETKDGWLTLVEAPDDGWAGQEIKRTEYFRSSDTIALPGDWLVQVDGDEELIEDAANYAGKRLRDFLAEQPASVVTVYVGIRNVREGPGGEAMPAGNFDLWPKVFRWQPGLRYGREHWDILAPDGRRLWDLGLNLRDHRAAVWPYFRFNHWSDVRAEERKRAKSAYENFRGEFRRVHGCMNPEEK
jgi:hypothetical protein